MPSLLAAPPPRPAGRACPLSLISHSLSQSHSQSAPSCPSPTSLISTPSPLPSPCVEFDDVCSDATSTAYEIPQPSDSSLVGEQLSTIYLMQQSFYSQVTDSLARFVSKLDDVYDKIAALEANKVSRKAMDAESDKQMDLLKQI